MRTDPPRLVTWRRRSVSFAVALAALCAGIVGVALADVRQPTGTTFSAVAGQQFSGRVAEFLSSNPNVANFDAGIEWGDGTRSSGTIVSCPTCEPRNRYYVEGSHTYARPGSYPTAIHIASIDDGTRGDANGTANVTSETPPPPSGRVRLTGPSAITFGEPAAFTADWIPDIERPGEELRGRYQWDFDGSGQFATDGGTSPKIEYTFAKPGSYRVGVRVTGGAGEGYEAFQDVTVDRPPLTSLRWFPLDPKPGQKVRFTLDNIHDPNTRIAYFAWKFGGLRPIARTIPLRLRRSASGAARSAAKKRTSGPAVLTSRGADLSVRNSFTRTFPRKGVFRVSASAVATDGTTATVHADVGVARKTSPIAVKGGLVSVTDCAKSALPCPQIAVSGLAVSGFPVTFDGSFPAEPQTCLPTTKPGRPAILLKKDLGYPADFPGGPGNVFEGPGPGPAIGARRGDPPTARSAAPNCVKLFNPFRGEKPEPWQWDFGDGVKVPAGSLASSNGAPAVISHTYAKPGTYDVSLTSRATVKVPDPSETKPSGQAQAAKSSWQTVYLKQTVQVTILESFCGALKLHGVPLRSGNGCFIRISPEGSSEPIWKAFPGDGLDLNGVAIGGPPVEPDAALVNPKKAQIYSLGWPLSGGVAGLALGGPPSCAGCTGPLIYQITVPKPVHNAELGRKAAELTSLAPFGSVGGLQVLGGHVFVSTDQPAVAEVNLKLPPIFTGTAKGFKQSAPTQVASNHDTDFSAELPAVKVGPFETEGVVIKHRKLSAGGGWYGGGSIGLFGIGLEAPYIPPSSSSGKCAEGGPSGFSLTEGGDFEFAGASLKLEPPATDIPIPPFLGLHCIQVAGSAQPFTLQGKVGLRIPANTNLINLDGCFLIAILDAGESASGCGTNNYKAPVDETWLRSNANVSVANFIDLGGAHFDFHKGNGLLKTEVGGHFGPIHFGPFYAKASVEGLLQAEPFAFQFFGHGEIGMYLPLPLVPDIDIGPVSAEVLVSSNGLAGCALILTVGYVWGEGFFGELGGCDLKDTPAAISAFSPGLQGPLVGAGAAGPRRISVRRGLPAAGFLATGVDGSPQLTVTDPRGRRYVDDGTGFQQGRGFAIGRMPQKKQTMLKITGRPRAGTWTIDAQPGSSAIADVDLHEGLPALRLRARVRGRGPGRRLVYSKARVPGQTVTFYEQGRTVGRRIGVARGRRGSLPFPPGYGTAGRRRVFAIVAHDGMPRDRIPVTSYVAPRPPRVAKPRRLRARARGKRLSLRWKRARGAARYQLTVKVGDGRVLNLKTKRTSISIPAYRKTMWARATLVALARDGRESKPTKLRVKAKRRKTVLRL